MSIPFTTQTLQEALTAKLALNFGTGAGRGHGSGDAEGLRPRFAGCNGPPGRADRQGNEKRAEKQVTYLSLEFLMGRSLMKNAYNLGVLPQLKEALEGMGFKAADLFELEPDAGLGNGGLGRLAACYLDSMTTLEIPATRLLHLL